MTSQLQQTNLPHTSLSKLLESATSLEEAKAMLAAMEETGQVQISEPDVYYRWLQEKFKDLEGVEITRQDAAVKYGMSDEAVARWEKQGLVKVLQPAKRRGLFTYVNEKDVAVIAEMNRRFRTGKSGPIKGWKPPIKQKSA